MASEIDTAEEVPGASRRAFLRRSAVVGGSLLWAAPTVQLLDLSAKAAASTSGHQCVPTPPSCCYFLCRIDLAPHGCNSSWNRQQCFGFQWSPGVGFTAPKGTNNPLSLPGTPQFDAGSAFYNEVLSVLNNPYFSKWLVKVDQTSIRSGNVNVPSYAVTLSNTFFSPVSSNGQNYCGYSLNSGGASFCDYNRNNPWGWDCYLFQGYSHCTNH